VVLEEQPKPPAITHPSSIRRRSSPDNHVHLRVGHSPDPTERVGKRFPTSGRAARSDQQVGASSSSSAGTSGNETSGFASGPLLPTRWPPPCAAPSRSARLGLS